MELANALIYKITREVGFHQAKAQDHEKNKVLVTSLISEVDAVTKENQRLNRVIKESEEQRSSSEQAKINRLTKDLEEAQVTVSLCAGDGGVRQLQGTSDCQLTLHSMTACLSSSWRTITSKRPLTP